MQLVQEWTIQNEHLLKKSILAKSVVKANILTREILEDELSLLTELKDDMAIFE